MPEPDRSPTHAHGYIAIGALLAGSGVALGALGAHALKATLEPSALEAYRTAALYQLLHGIAIVTLAGGTHPPRAVMILLAVGCVLFSGSIYGLVLADWSWLGPITPLGGVSFIAGWLLLVVVAWRRGS